MNTPAATFLPTPLPILTFDDAPLSPSLGYVFNARWLDPYESLVSMLWKFAWVNGLPGHLVMSHVAKRPVDPFEGITVSADDIDVRRVARLLRVPPTTIRTACRRARVPRLQVCVACMSRGYHGIAHQLGSDARCPVHGRPLVSECRGCGESTAWRLDARLLDAPFRCGQCRRRYGVADFIHRKPMSRPVRMALTRTVLGLDTPVVSKPASRRR